MLTQPDYKALDRAFILVHFQVGRPSLGFTRPKLPAPPEARHRKKYEKTV